MKTETTNLPLLGPFWSRASEINAECIAALKMGIYPMSMLSMKKRVVGFVDELQTNLALMSRQDNNNLEGSLKVVEYFAFSLVIRIYAVEQLRGRGSRGTAGTDGVIMSGANDTDTLLKLIEKTDFKHIDFSTNMEVRYVEIPKKDSNKV